MARVWRSIDAEDAKRHDLYGVKGWLLFFAIGIPLGFLKDLAPLSKAALDAGTTMGQLLSVDAPVITYIKIALLIDTLTMVGICVLLFTKYARFRLVASLMMLTSWPIAVLIGWVAPFEGIGLALSMGIVPWMLTCAVWVTYLQRSRRVRVTFEHCILENLATVSIQKKNEIRTNDQETLATGALIPSGSASQMAVRYSTTNFETSVQDVEMIEVDEGAVYTHVANELETGNIDKGQWTRLFAECDGDEAKVKILYIRQRAAKLIADQQARIDHAKLKRANLAREVPEFLALSVQGYIPIGRSSLSGLLVRHLLNGMVAIETSHQQRCYRDVESAALAAREFVQEHRWTLKGLVTAFDRVPGEIRPHI